MENSIVERRDGFSTHYVISGDPAYVDGEVAKIVRNYHPAGYGTHVKASLVGGAMVAHVTRSNSCD